MRVEALRGEAVVCIAAGGHHSCAALRNGQVYSWGLDDNGQLGGGGGGGEPCREGGGSSQHEDSGQHSGQQPAPGGLAPLHFPPGGVGPRQSHLEAERSPPISPYLPLSPLVSTLALCTPSEDSARDRPPPTSRLGDAAASGAGPLLHSPSAVDLPTG